MSKDKLSFDSNFAWSLLLGLCLLVIVLAIKWPLVWQAAGINQAAVSLARDWTRESKDLSEIVCGESPQPLIPVAVESPAKAAIAARRAYFAGDCQHALAYWTLVVEQEPHNETAAIMRFLSSGLDKGLLPAGKADADISAFLKGLGMQAEHTDKANQAGFWFAYAFEMAPSRSVAEKLVLSTASQDEQAAIWLELANALPESDPDYWWALGQSAELRQDWDRALDAYRSGAEIAPRPYPYLMRQGAAGAELMDWEEAIAAFQKASAFKPGDFQPYLEMGHVYRRQRDFENAGRAYEQALSYSPNSFSANYFAGLTAYRLENDKQAKQYLQRSLELRPKHAESAYYLALSLKRAGDIQSALKYLEQALAFQADKPLDWLVTLGDWRYTEGDEDGALAVYSEALKMQPSNNSVQDKINEIEESQ